MSSIHHDVAEDPEKPVSKQPAESGQAAPEPEPETPLSPDNCRNFIRRQTADAMPKIVKTFVQKAEAGSVPHFTSLAKVGGFDHHSAQTETPKRSKRRSLARQLLDEVEKYEARKAAEKAAAQAAAQNQCPQERP